MARVRGNAGTTRGFLQAVNKWTRETDERVEAALQNTALEFFYALRRATPVLTGNLRDSLIAGPKGTVTTAVTGPSEARSGEEISIAAIMGLNTGDRVEFVYSATYAMRQNYGFVGTDILGRTYNQAGKFWIEAVGSQYRSIARRVATDLRMQFK